MGALPLTILCPSAGIRTVASITSIPHPLGSCRIQVHLLLLPKSLLPFFFLTPSACAVGARPQKYRGERFLLVFQNLHRYFLYIALIFCVILIYDAIVSFSFENGLGVGVGSIIMTLNAVFLTAFTLGCNSLRHLVGGNVDCYSCANFGHQRYQAWKFVSLFNVHHNFWAWISLFWVGFTDLYIRLVSMSIITDYRIL